MLVPKSGTDLLAIPQCVFHAVDTPAVAIPGDPFSRPDEYYLHYVEPTENELAKRVEYDMDEQGMHDGMIVER